MWLGSRSVPTPRAGSVKVSRIDAEDPPTELFSKGVDYRL